MRNSVFNSQQAIEVDDQSGKMELINRMVK